MSDVQSKFSIAQDAEQSAREQVRRAGGDPGMTETGSHVMTKRLLGSMLALGVASVLALSSATPSLGQTQQRQRAPAQQDQGLSAVPQDETFGQAAPRGQSQSRGAAAQQCWITTNADLNYGYWGECSAKGARPVR